MEAHRQGLTFYQAGQYEQAIPFWRKALELGVQDFGTDHPTTADLLDNLAQLYHLRGRDEAAEPLYKRALAIREKVLGPDHPDACLGWCENQITRHGRSRRTQAAEASGAAPAFAASYGA